MQEKNIKYEKHVFLVILILAIAGFSGGGYLYYRVAQGIVRNTADLEGEVLELQNEKVALIDNLRQEKERNNMFAGQIGEIIGTVGRLDKLSKTDEELLQKYSKIYFLNENYIPEDLTKIPPDYVNEKGREMKFHTKAFPYLQDMIETAEKDGMNLKIISSFRSFGEQSALKNAYSVTYGSGANKFSADQGYSEHQLGTTVDFTTAELGAGFTDFDTTEGYKWLQQNAYKYGFILSYPKGNAYYIYEPWHWRFVGKKLAFRLHEEEENFYDLEQRAIDNYLISIFD